LHALALDPSRYDFLFVLVGDGRRWFIPSHVVRGRRRVIVGGPKYSEFQIEIGDDDRAKEGASTIEVHPGERRSGRAGPACKVGASLLSGFESHLPHHAERRPYWAGTRTTISPQHKITIPIRPFRDAELHIGDRLSATPLAQVASF
jgi:hypothetical protein